jgi:hypothetical protein
MPITLAIVCLFIAIRRQKKGRIPIHLAET